MKPKPTYVYDMATDKYVVIDNPPNVKVLIETEHAKILDYKEYKRTPKH
jgi:hypothetical protein